MIRRAWARAATYAFFNAGAIGWVYSAVTMAHVAPVGAVACAGMALLSAASPWLIEEYT